MTATSSVNTETAPAGGGRSAPGIPAPSLVNGLDATRGPYPGKHRVQIYWAKKTGRKVPNGDGGMQDETAEGLPAKFNKNSELTATVSSWSNTVDFNLTP
jgi:hypothetical protein